MTYNDNTKDNEKINNYSIDEKNIYKITKNGKSYEINKNIKLGEGSYSYVYLGKMIEKNSDVCDQETIKFVAVKKIVKRNLTPRGMTMLNSEIQIMKDTMTYNHDNIIKCYDVIDDIDVIYIIMEYCENGDLSALLIGHPLKYKYVKYYFGKILCALKYLNDKKIIHRDLKPKNILVSNKFHDIKLCDFGFAKQFDGLKRVMTVCGSPLYMAPEIYQKIGYTSSVDVWALGIILYEMLFGVHPLVKYNDPIKIANSITNNDIEIPINTKKIDEIEDECITILKKMLKKDINRITMAELLKENWIMECMCACMDTTLLNSEEFINNDIYIVDQNVNNNNNDIIDSDYKKKSNTSDNLTVTTSNTEKELSFVFDMED